MDKGIKCIKQVIAMPGKSFLTGKMNARMQGHISKARGGRTADNEKWWRVYEGVHAKLEAVGFDWSRITLEKEEQTWRDGTRGRRKTGSLDLKQHEALKIIGFPFNDTLPSGQKLHAAPKLTELIKLFERSSDPESAPLNKEEAIALEKGLNTARERYKAGQMSEKSARKLGIIST